MTDTATLQTRAAREAAPRPPWALIGFAPLVCLLVIWQLVSAIAPSPFLPPPSDWFAALVRIGWGQIVLSVGATLLTFVLGVTIATLVGSLLGVLIGGSGRVERALSPTLEFLRGVPAPVMVPIAVLAWGSGLATSLTAVAFAACWPVLMNTVTVIKSRPALYRDVARTLRLTHLQEIKTMIIPGAVPGALVGYRIAVPLALIVTILVEMLTAVPGIGSLLLSAQRSYDSATAFGLLCIAGMIGYGLSLLSLALTHRLLRRWPPELR